MPPTHTDEGLVAARRIREGYPGTAVVLLSQYLEPRYAERLLADQPGGLGYLLKERVSDIEVLVDALRRVGEGECVLDPTIVAELMQPAGAPTRRSTGSPRGNRDPRPDGRGPVQRRHRPPSSGSASAPSRRVRPGVPEAGSGPSTDTNRRVLAVLTLLRT